MLGTGDVVWQFDLEAELVAFKVQLFSLRYLADILSQLFGLFWCWRLNFGVLYMLSTLRTTKLSPTLAIFLESAQSEAVFSKQSTVSTANGKIQVFK